MKINEETHNTIKAMIINLLAEEEKEAKKWRDINDGSRYQISRDDNDLKIYDKLTKTYAVMINLDDVSVIMMENLIDFVSIFYKGDCWYED